MHPTSTADSSAFHFEAALAQRYEHHLQLAASQPTPSTDTADCTLLMVRGLFGNWIPNHFRAPLRHFRHLGWQVEIGRTAAAGTLAHNAAALGSQIDELIANGRRPIFLAHSKGALEVMLALEEQPMRAAATAGFIGVQVPRGGAPYLEHLFPGADNSANREPRQLSEYTEATLLIALGARAACAELNTRDLRALAARLDALVSKLPALMVATSAKQMSSVLELRSSHLGQVHPGRAHDGVFLTADQVWSSARMLHMEGIDHSQPSAGGLGFAHDLFWAALLATLLD